MSDRRSCVATNEYFERLYRRNADPWNYETSDYERSKYHATLAALPRERYRSALEIGCSIGVMTELLAGRCETLLAIDASATAVRHARVRCSHLAQVRIETRRVPDEFPSGPFDLIVMSEVGYYLSPDDLRRTTARIVAQLTPRGHLLLVHHTARIGDATMSGHRVHEVVLGELLHSQPPLVSLREALYRLDLLERQ